MRIGNIILAGAIGYAIWPSIKQLLTPPADQRPSDLATSPAVHHRDPAADLEAGTYGATRNAGPESMRDGPAKSWGKVDETSDQSFPASDPPSTY